MKISKTQLRQIIKEELSETDLPKWEGEPFGEYDLEAENEKGRQEETYVALVNYAADKMRRLFELGHDVATVEGEVKSDVLKMVNDALEEAADIEL